MTIEIRRPELEVLILERMASGAFHDVEDALLAALRTTVSKASTISKTEPVVTGRALIEAIQQSPYREFDIEVPRYPQPVRDVELSCLAG